MSQARVNVVSKHALYGAMQLQLDYSHTEWSLIYLEEWRDSRAAEEHEDVVGGGRDVGAAPGLDREAVAAAAKDDGVAGGQVGVVEGEGTVGVVDVEDAVGP